MDTNSYLDDFEQVIEEGADLVENDLRIWWGNPVLHVSEPTEEESSSSEFDPVNDCTTPMTAPYFEVFHEKKTWWEAEEFCVSNGGHLASVHSAFENT